MAESEKYLTINVHYQQIHEIRHKNVKVQTVVNDILYKLFSSSSVLHPLVGMVAQPKTLKFAIRINHLEVFSQSTLKRVTSLRCTSSRHSTKATITVYVDVEAVANRLQHHGLYVPTLT